MKHCEPIRPPLSREIAACLCVVVLCGLSKQVHTQSDAPGTHTATGSITVNGNLTGFNHAYAVMRRSLFDNKPETILTLTDKPLSAKAISDTFARSSEMRNNSIQTLEFTLDAGNTIRSVDFNVGTLKGGANTSDYKAEISRFNPTAFSGHVTSGGKHSEFKNTLSFDVRFDTTMLTPRTPDAAGETAWATPQGKAIAEYLRAARAGDKAALKTVLMADHATQLDGPNAAQLLEFLKLSPNPNTAEFDSLTVDSDSAEAKLTERSKNGAESSNYTLRLIKGVWFVAP